MYRRNLIFVISNVRGVHLPFCQLTSALDLGSLWKCSAVYLKAPELNPQVQRGNAGYRFSDRLVFSFRLCWFYLKNKKLYDFLLFQFEYGHTEFFLDIFGKKSDRRKNGVVAVTNFWIWNPYSRKERYVEKQKMTTYTYLHSSGKEGRIYRHFNGNVSQIQSPEIHVPLFKFL